MLGTFFDFTGDDVSTMLVYVKDLVADFTPLLIPILAIGLGLLIIYGIVSAIKG